MKSFYFRSIMLVFIIIGLLSVTGCSIYPAITPVEELHHVSIEKKNVAKNDVDMTKEEVNHELEDVTGSVYEDDAENAEQKDAEHAGNIEQDDPTYEQLNVDFEAQPIIDLTDEEKAKQSDDETNEHSGENTEKSTDVQIDEKHIALTFDDGPDLNYTPQVLDILKEKNIKATFFIVGVQIKKYPEVVQRMVEEGHLIANHTYYHPNLNSLKKNEILQELDTTDALIQSIVGFTPRIVRPPYGAMNKEVREIIEDSGRSVVLWNIDPRDWDSTPPEDMFANIMQNAKDEGNILFHSFGGKQIQNTVDVLPRVIDALLGEGYTFVTANHFLDEHDDNTNVYNESNDNE